MTDTLYLLKLSLSLKELYDCQKMAYVYQIQHEN